MKLRFRANSLRLRVNQNEVETLATGGILRHQIDFPGNTTLSYSVTSILAAEPQAFFAGSAIQVSVPCALVAQWASGDDVGLYFTLTTAGEPLRVAIEKDLDCIDGPLEEKDPQAFPRTLMEKRC